MRASALLFIIGVSGSFIGFSITARAQGCCSVGTSALGGTERGSAGAGSLVVGGSYHFYSLDQGYQGTRRIEDPLQRTASVEMLGVELEYGLAEGVAVMLQMGYFSKSRTITVRGSSFEPPERIAFNGYGFGDLLTLIKYQILEPSITAPAEVAIGGGAKLPVGRYRQEVRGARLSLDLQAGTGAADLLGWVYGSYSFPPVGMKAYGWMLHRYPGANFDNYRYGDETLLTLGVLTAPVEFLEIGLAARARIADRDFSNGRLLQSTGGVQFSLVPHISYLTTQSVFRFFGHIPVHQNMYGIQLGISYVLGIELRYSFDFTNG